MNRARIIEDCYREIRRIEKGMFKVWVTERTQRIRSLIRRLKRCPICKDGVIAQLGEIGGHSPRVFLCPRCNGTGTVA